MDANQIKLIIWRDLSHRPKEDDNSPAAWDSHRRRRTAVKRIFGDPAYRFEEIGGNRLDDEKNTHELVEFFLWLVGQPVVQAVSIYIGAKIVDKLTDEVIDRLKILLVELWEARKNKEIQSVEIQLPNGDHIKINEDGTFYPPEVRVDERPEQRSS